MKQFKVTLLLTLLLTGTSCWNCDSNQTDVTGVLSTDIIGAWDMVESLELTPEGWVGEDLPEDYRYIMNYRADGTIEGTLTENGRTGTGECPYFVDDSRRTIKQMWRVYNVERLTRDTLVVIFQYSPGKEAADSIVAKCTYKRIENEDYLRSDSK